MKSISAETQSILASRQFYKADCYTVTLVGGGTAYLTTWGQTLTLNGVTYQAGGPILTRSQLSQKIGLEVTSLTVTLYPKPTDLLLGEPWLAALRQGQLDGATVTLTRAFMSAPGDTSGGGVLMFNGRVAEVEISRTSASITVNAWTELLSIKMPRNVYQSGCGWTLFDQGCGVGKAAHAGERHYRSLADGGRLVLQPWLICRQLLCPRPAEHDQWRCRPARRARSPTTCKIPIRPADTFSLSIR